ncbi:MAG: DegT/DnrJ/EryC1/StrS family aminotransferase, partial [Terriglobales bacterium]
MRQRSLNAQRNLEPAAPDAGRLPMAEPVLGERELELASQAVRSGWISSKGEFVTAFEEAFSRYCGVAHGVAVSSGTAAL